MNSPMIRTRTDGHKDTDRWTHRHGQMDTQTRTDRHTDTDRWTHRHGQMDTQTRTDGHRRVQRDRQTDGPNAHRQTNM